MLGRRLMSLGMVAILVVTIVSTTTPARADDVQVMAGNFLGQYYGTANLSGPVVVTRSDASINFNWGFGSPDPALLPDQFSARWTGSIPVAVAGIYIFTVTVDDGVRLWVDGNPLIDHWTVQPATTYSANISLATGTHTVRVEYFENYGAASIAVTWGMTGPSSTFSAEYFNNPTLTGSPALMRVDPVVDFDWGFGSPAPEIQPDGFSARWTATINFATSGAYDFHVVTDDGARLYLDGAQIIDAWHLQPATEYTTTRNVTAGPHQVRLQYFEQAGVAVARLWWVAHTAPSEVIVDDLSPRFTRGGPWYQAGIGYLGHMFWTRNATTAQENWGRWTPLLPAPGQYEVFAFIPSNYATTHNARYLVYHNGHGNSRSVDQFIYYDAWVSLGTYDFNAIGGEYVFLNDVTGEPYLSRRIGFDAVKLVYKGP